MLLLLWQEDSMKKILLLAVFLSLLLIPFQVFAQVESSPSAQTLVDYTLPYPGLLPDSPIYFLKTARDRIISFLISDPLKKAEFNLLQADKRLAAGVYLANKNKYGLANTTISKGENYFESAIAKAEEAKKLGFVVSSLAANLQNSARKHQEVIKELEEKTKGELRAKFGQEAKRAAEFEKKAKLILSQ